VLKEEIETITMRLQSFREELNLYILVNSRYMLQFHIPEPPSLLEQRKIDSVFLQRGADPMQCIPLREAKYSAYDLVDVFKEEFPDETRELKEQIAVSDHRAKHASPA
jgi:hypothetical protein